MIDNFVLYLAIALILLMGIVISMLPLEAGYRIGKIRKHGSIQGLDKKTDWKISFFFKLGLDIGIPFAYWLTSGIKIRQSELLDFQEAWFEAIDQQQNWNDETKKPVKQAATILLRFCEVDNAYFICFHEMIAKSLRLRVEYFPKSKNQNKRRTRMWNAYEKA
jgi:hypothetical protein